MKGGVANGIVNYIHPLSIRDTFHFLNEIGFGVENDVICAMIFDEPRFLIGGDSADDGSSKDLGDLDQQQARASCGCMNQASLARLERKGRVSQVMGRHALEHQGCGLIKTDGVRQIHQT